MTEIDIEDLLKKAQKATPGPWVPHDIGDPVMGERQTYWVWRESKLPYYGAVLGELDDYSTPKGAIGEAAIDGERGTEQEEADARYISAVDPQTVIELIRRLKEAEETK